MKVALALGAALVGSASATPLHAAVSRNLGEIVSVAEGAARETVEESGAEFELEGLFSLVNVARVGQVHLFYRARLLSDRFNPGFETIEARLFAEDEIPWDEIAFRTVKETLERYFADRRAGSFSIHAIDIT